MSEKFANGQGEGILQLRHARTHEKTQHQSLFDVFGDEGFNSGTIQSYAQERHVETFHAQRIVQIDRRTAASIVELQWS